MEMSYDPELNKVSPLLMLPWIGENYNKTRVLFVGESDYDEGTGFHPNWKREWIQNMRITATKTDSKLLNNIDKTLLGIGINPERQRNLWNSVAYTNLTQRAMNWQVNHDDKPTNSDLLTGWQTILHILLIVKPQFIIKWGIKGDGILRGNKYSGWQIENITNDRFLLLKHDSGFTTRILFTHHPSRSYKPEKWSETISNNLPKINSLFSL